MTWRLLLLGFGNVGRELARLLLAQRPALERRGLDFRVTGIATRRGGLIADPNGLDLASALGGRGAGGGVPSSAPAHDPGTTPVPPSGDWSETIRSFPADVVLEMTPLRVDRRGEPARSHVRAALEAGKHVVTANKGPVAWAYRELDAAAREVGRRFLFEATVMDGAPVFSLFRHTLPGCRVTAFRGVLNTTTNYVLTRIAAGADLPSAVKEAQAGGFAEADPSLDIEGWDAAVKVTCLANVLMDARLVPEDVERRGIAGLSPADVRREAARGRVLKLVARAGRGETTTATAGKEPGSGGVRASVRLESLPGNDILALVDGTSSALTITTDLMGPITVFEHSPHIGQTAYGVFRDLLEIAEDEERRRS